VTVDEAIEELASGARFICVKEYTG